MYRRFGVTLLSIATDTGALTTAGPVILGALCIKSGCPSTRSATVSPERAVTRPTLSNSKTIATNAGRNP